MAATTNPMTNAASSARLNLALSPMFPALPVLERASGKIVLALRDRSLMRACSFIWREDHVKAYRHRDGSGRRQHGRCRRADSIELSGGLRQGDRGGQARGQG